MAKFYEKMLKRGPTARCGSSGSSSGDVEAKAMAIAVLLGRVHNARRMALNSPKRKLRDSTVGFRYILIRAKFQSFVGVYVSKVEYRNR